MFEKKIKNKGIKLVNVRKVKKDKLVSFSEVFIYIEPSLTKNDRIVSRDGRGSLIAFKN